MSAMRFGAADAWVSAVYGQANPNTVQFLRDQFHKVSDYATEYGKQFYEKSLKSFEFFNGSRAVEFTRSIVGKMRGNTVDETHIVAYSTMEEFNKASLLMQRWIMANPAVRKRYHEQQCDGYSETYHDLEPGVVGAHHYDYRRAVEGMVRFEEDGGYVISNFFEELKDGDRNLVIDEKVCIVADTWVSAESLLKAHYDITNRNGGML
jgi:hypothetical protein